MTDPVAANEANWAAAARWAADDRMNELETLMWRNERHPEVSSTITSLFILDQLPEWDRYYAAMRWASELIGRCRQRVLDPLLPVGPPAWVPDEHFDLDYHVRRAQLPAPGTMRALLDLTQGVALTPFDRSRPLWETVLVEGLSDGRAACVIKLHHSLTDGLGGIQLMSLLNSRTREHTPKQPPPSVARPARDAASLAADEVAGQLRALPSVAGRLLSAGLRGLGQPQAALDDGVRFAASMRRALTPAPGSPLLRPRSGRTWRFGTLECSLASLRAAGKAGGGSLNDAYVAALLGGLRRYHERFDVELDELPMAMPVSLRKANDPMGGNKFAGALFAAPIGIVDPAERIATVRGIVLSVRVEPAINFMTLAAPVMNRMPRALAGLVYSRAGSLADLSASNVPGSPEPGYLAGARVERVYPFGPLPGVAVMATMVSHGGVCCVGINADGTAIADPDLLMTCLQAGLDEVLELSKETP